MKANRSKRFVGRFKSHIKVFSPALLCLFWLTPTWSQEESSGTAIVIGWQKDKIVVAADSRDVDHKTGEYRNDDCKIIAPNNKLLFVSIGTRRFDLSPKVMGAPFNWDSHKIAMKAFTALKSDSIETFAQIWGSIGTRMLNKIPPQYREDIASETGLKDTGSGLLVVGLDQKGEIDAQLADITFEKGVFVSGAMPTPRNQINGLGAGKEIFKEFVFRETKRATDNISLWRLTVENKTPDEVYRSWITQLLQWMILYDPSGKLGGEPEVVELHTGGTIYWVQYGPCKQQ